VAVLYLGRVVEEGATEDVFRPPWHPYTEALLSAVPTLGGLPATGAIRLEGPAPNPAAPPPGCPFHPRCPRKLGPVCETQTPPVLTGERGHAIACHIPRADLLGLQVEPADPRPTGAV
jgi:peptide/nickel transport system ATP-binding protein